MNGGPFWYDGDRVGGFFTLQAAFGVFFGVGWLTPPSPLMVVRGLSV
jgi:hypothetical protein